MLTRIFNLSSTPNRSVWYDSLVQTQDSNYIDFSGEVLIFAIFNITMLTHQIAMNLKYKHWLFIMSLSSAGFSYYQMSPRLSFPQWETDDLIDWRINVIYS